MKVVAKGKGDTPDRVYEIGFGGSLEKITAQMGEEWVLAACMKAAHVEAERVVKRYERTGMTADQIVEAMTDWHPGAEVKKATNKVKGVLKKYADLSDADKAALREALGI